MYEAEDQKPAPAMVVDLSYSGMRIAVDAPPLAATVSVVLQAGEAGIAFPCRVLGSLVAGDEVFVRTRFERLDEAQLGVLEAIISRLDELEHHGPDMLAG
ncbi:MAG: PilZ domain-containing protein [Dehalococcoidia bacterium]|nr:PilZ domain-containing protein [Dehalococcoidia bacterium]